MIINCSERSHLVVCRICSDSLYFFYSFGHFCLHFLISLVRVLLILWIFSKEQLLVSVFSSFLFSFFFFFFGSQGMRDLSSFTRGWICGLCSGSMVSQPLDRQAIPHFLFHYFLFLLWIPFTYFGLSFLFFL